MEKGPATMVVATMAHPEPARQRLPADMSPEAIDRRLRTIAELRRLGLALRSARRLGKVRELARPATAGSTSEA